MDNDIFDIAKGLCKIWHDMYQAVEPIVYDIVNYEIKDVNYIEQTLDFCMDIPTPEGEELFYFLCEYYLTIDKITAMKYMKMYYDDNCNFEMKFTTFIDPKIK